MLQWALLIFILTEIIFDTKKSLETQSKAETAATVIGPSLSFCIDNHLNNLCFCIDGWYQLVY